MKKPARKSRPSNSSSNTTEVHRIKARADVIADVRRVVRGAIEPQALSRLLWDSKHQIDIDQVVDLVARTHRADGYRDPRLQKEALDALQTILSGALSDHRHDF